MTLEELLKEYERRVQDAQRIGAIAPVDKIYGVVLDELTALDGVSTPVGMMNTTEAGNLLRKAPKTVARWARLGRFPGAVRANGLTGEWMLPPEAVWDVANGRSPKQDARPKLWSPRFAQHYSSKRPGSKVQLTSMHYADQVAGGQVISRRVLTNPIFCVRLTSGVKLAHASGVKEDLAL